MSTSGSVIDLGVYSFEPEADPEPVSERGGWGPEWHRLRRVPPQRWLTALLVPVLLATLDTAAPRSELEPLWVVPGWLLTADTTTAYGIEVNAADGTDLPTGEGATQVPEGSAALLTGTTTITAYHLADGARRWRQTLPGADWWTAELTGGVLLLRSALGEWGSGLVALDPATGALRWQAEGEYLFTVAERWLLLVGSGAAPPDGGGGVPNPGQTPDRVTVVDVQTGAIAWTDRLAPGEQPVLGSAGDLLTIQPSGRLTRYDPATGRVLATAETAPVSQPGKADRPERAAVVAVVSDGGIVTSAHERQAPLANIVHGLVIVTDGSGASAYDVTTLRQRWWVELEAPGWVASCGSLLCVHEEPDALHAVDPATGGIQWSRSCDQDLASGPGTEVDHDFCHLIPPVSDAGVPSRQSPSAAVPPVSDAAPVLLRRLTLSGDDTVLTNFAVAEKTGETHAELTGWRPTGLRQSDRMLMVSEPSAESETDPRVWVGWWQAEARGLELLGPAAATDCRHLTGDYLACWVPDDSSLGEMTVWRVGAG